MPNRVLRDWTTSEAIDGLSVHAEVFFTRLIMKADDYGNYTGNHKLLKAALFPLRDVMINEIDKWIEECAKVGIIKKYTSDGKDFIHIPNFGQRLRAMKSNYPTFDSHMSDTSRPETKRNEVETETETNACDFDDLFLKAFDENTCESYKMPYRGIDLGAELQKFRTKCDNNKAKYYAYDVGALRSAFQYQLNHVRSNGKGTNNKQQHTDSIKDTIRNTYGYTGK